MKMPATDRRNQTLKLFSVSMTVIFLAILLVFNIVFDQLLGEKLKWDWSSGQMYSLGDVSVAILAEMDQPVTLTALFREEEAATFGYASILPLLKEYEEQSDGQLTVRYIDPDRTPSVLSEIDPSGYLAAQQGDLVFTSQATGKGKVVRYEDLFQTEVDYQTYQTVLTGVTAEQSLTGAIQYVLSPVTPTIYFTRGHDEPDYETDYAAITGLLKNNNFAVTELDLFAGDPVPQDCSVLVMIDPKKDLTRAEFESIDRYLRTGGSLMVIASFGTADLPQLNAVLADYDLALSQDKIRESSPDHRLNDDPYMLRAIAPASSITPQAIDGFTLADNVRAIDLLSSGKDYIQTEAILTTSGQGVREMGGDPLAGSAAGTQVLAAISTHEGYVDGSSVTDSTRVMVVGSSSVFGDALINQFGSNIYNAGLFFYSIQWLSGSDAADVLYIEAKVPPSYAVASGNATVNGLVSALAILVIPAVLFGLALWVYRRRKNL
ncbi:MAG: hypothetical protein EOM08_02415 [Clostridia bacterium]|nr:hypothetical protein [Clostridia bacterium]NCC75269.1 hypothetical protein [Clostridia bacterium]